MYLYFLSLLEVNLRGSVNFSKYCPTRAVGGTGLHGVSSLVMIGRLYESVLTHLLLSMVTLISLEWETSENLNSWIWYK